MSIYYDDQVVGNYVADMIVNDIVLVELKAVKTLDNIHHAQLIHYLKATKLPLGFLFNFGAESVQFKRIINV